MRALSGHSSREIADKKQELGCELRAIIYFYDEQKFIISAVAGISEYGRPTIIDDADSDEAIGLAVCDKLLEFKQRTEKLSFKPKSDGYGTYNSSGAKTRKSFELKSICISVSTVNISIQFKAAHRVSNEKSLKAACSNSNGNHSEIGAEIRKSIQATKVLRNAGML
jgi:hypothetical protein